MSFDAKSYYDKVLPKKGMEKFDDCGCRTWRNELGEIRFSLCSTHLEEAIRRSKCTSTKTEFH